EKRMNDTIRAAGILLRARGDRHDPTRVSVTISVCAAIAIAGFASLANRPVLAQSSGNPMFAAARWLSGSVPALPSPNAIGWIDETLELTVDETGRVESVRPLESTTGPSLVAPAATTWRFQPAIEHGRTIPSHVLVAAVFRPAETYNAPTAGSATRTVEPPSPDIPFPSASVDPVYPPLAVGDAVAIVEVLVGADGMVQTARLI